MNEETLRSDVLTSAPRWLLWATILVVGVVFFATVHSFSLTEEPDWSVSADWAEDVEGGLARSAKTLALPIMAVYGVFLLVLKSRRPMRLDDWLTLALVGYVATCALSVLWSVNPSLTVRRTGLVAVWSLTALGIAKHFSLRDIMFIAVSVTATFAAIGFAAELAHHAFRPLASDYRFAGTVHPNAQGINDALLCMAGLGMAAVDPRRRKIYLTLAAFGFAAMLLTKSRMSLGSLLAAGGLVWAIRWPRRKQMLAALLSGAGVCAVMLVAQFTDFNPLDDAKGFASLGREEEMESLTGRLPLWKELSGYISAEPLHGYGYRAFWDRQHTLEISDALGGWQVPHAHNGYLDTSLDFGIPAALVFVLAAYLATARAGVIYGHSSDPADGFAFAILVYALFDSFLESNFVIPNFVPFVAICAAYHIALHAGVESTAPAWASSARSTA